MVGKALGKVFATASNLVLGIAESKATEKVIGAAAKSLGFGVDKGAKILENGIEGGKKIVGKAMQPSTYKELGKAINEGAGKVTRAVLTDEDSYSRVPLPNIVHKKTGPILKSNKVLIADELHQRVETGLNTVFGIARGYRVNEHLPGRLGNKVADAIHSENKLLNVPSAILKKASNAKIGLMESGGDNLLPFGMKATGLGVVAAAGFQVASGTPQAVKEWNKDRMGTNIDTQPQGVAPRVPAYAQNGGATGDLVFALNNLRHGGFM